MKKKQCSNRDPDAATTIKESQRRHKKTNKAK
jgi:hypothetical protein